MSGRGFSCVICGWLIYGQEGSVSWRNQFCGLYSCPEDIVLTGVGLYTDPDRDAFIASPDPSARWDDPGYGHPNEDRRSPDWWLNTPYSADPLARAEVDGILAETPQAVPRDVSFPSFTGSVASIVGKDPFNSLPVELCSAIAGHLPTRDALNARLASRSFWHLFDSQQFWASRFKGRNSDRSWLFEAPGLNKGARDWHFLYRRTADSHLGQGLRNRKRIWGLAQDLAVRLGLRLDGLASSSGFPPPWQGRWVLAAGKMRHETDAFSQLEVGCSQSRIAHLAMPSGITQVAASTVRLGNSAYIAGIALTTAAGEVIRLGYRDASERSVQLSSGLAGFNLAVGLGGIHALQTERLAVGTAISALKVGFDGFRMVSIALLQPPHTPGAPRHGTLRRSAIWYPDLPPPALWAYAASTSPSTGRCRPSAGALAGLNIKQAETTEFAIDGPGGEVIDSVEIYQQYPAGGAMGPRWLHEEGELCWLKMHTNRGRACEVGEKPKSRSKSKTVVRKEFSAAPGTAITGFFGAQYRNQASPITAFGVITELLRNGGGASGAEDQI
ncbi:hypothetical protein C8A01DRAFT_40772 [Parachaetomium inaequale]|uniref:F-box domain-containing protein n=1 Tax=Parachaetomium inaequale TaxID=2588326 RepID=A0AAN6SLH2_9PEZI|nr:hypothetical protein C8A01DRAFT_40772 [Parachaetomium inaequale]